MTNAPKSLIRDHLTTEREIELTEHELDLITGGDGTHKAPHVGDGLKIIPDHLGTVGYLGSDNGSTPWKPTHHR